MSFEWTFNAERWIQEEDNSFRLLDYAGNNIEDNEEKQPSVSASFFYGSPWCEEHGFLPSDFSFCPNCGRQLDRIKKGNTWWQWPGIGSTIGNSTFFREVKTSLAVQGWGNGNTVEEAAPIQLPDAGDFRFVVGSFGVTVPVLICIAIREGQLWYWLPKGRAGEWRYCEPVGSTITFPWACNSNDHHKALAWVPARGEMNQLYLPTDNGLARIDLDLAAGTYWITMLNDEPCLGAPVLREGFVMVPTTSGLFYRALEDQRKHESGTITFDDYLASPDYGQDISGDLTLEERYYHPPLLHLAQVRWLNTLGQLVVERKNGAIEGAFRPWPAGFKPKLDIATPYRSGNDRLWQLGFNDAAGRYYMVAIDDRGEPEQQPTDRPLHIAGRICVRDRCWVAKEDAPWRDNERWLAQREIQSNGTMDLHPLLYSDREIVGLIPAEPEGGSHRLVLLNRGNQTGRQQIDLRLFYYPLKPCLMQFVIWNENLYYFDEKARQLIGWKLICTKN